MVLQVSVVVAFAALAISFWFLQIVQHARFEEMAANNHQRTLALRAPRGVLFDRNGKVLVENQNTFNIALDREQSGDIDETLRILAAATGADEAAMRETVHRRRREPSYRPIVLIENATMEQVIAGPGYQSRLNAANQALERSAAAKGMLRSGNTLADVTELSSNFAGQAYDQEFNRALQAYDRAYQGAKDAFAPGLEAWRIRANTLAGMSRDRYNADLGLFVNNNSRGGGGGEFDPSPYIGDLLPPMPGPTAPPAPIPLPSGGGPINPMAAGDPWTDNFYY